MAFILDNLATIIISIILAVIIALVIRKLILDKKKGKCCGCSGCSGNETCPSKSMQDKR